MEPTPCYLQSQVVSVYQSIEKGCGYIDVLITFPGDTDPKYIYIYIYIYIYGFVV